MAYYYSPFRKKYTKKRASECPFCSLELIKQTVTDARGNFIENKHYRWIVNFYPKFEGHTMVVPKKHIVALGEETPEEIICREELIVKAADTLRSLYPGAGIEVFLQTGSGSESSVSHLHWHVVPAQPNDHLRSFDKLGQFYTIEPGKEKVVLFPVPIKRARQTLLKALAYHVGRKVGEYAKSSRDSRRKGDQTSLSKRSSQ